MANPTLAGMDHSHPAGTPQKLVIALLCAALFGVCVTAYVIFVPGHPYLMQVIASAIKVPIIIILSYSIAAALMITIAKVPFGSISTAQLLDAATECLIVAGISLGMFGPIIALIASMGNYSILIYSSYAAFALSGVAGSLGFYRRLRLNSPLRTRPTLIFVSCIWMIIFGVLECQIGWTMRPIVGWTGQHFTWFRHEHVQIWNQAYCEARNLQRGGVSFPTQGQQNDNKKWPC